MTTLTIENLHADGNVTISANYHDIADILDSPTDYPAGLVHELDIRWKQMPWEHKKFTISPELASTCVTAGVLDSIPNGWTFGYPHAYVGDGFLLCPDCVRKQVAELADQVDPEQMACELFVNQGDFSPEGETCDQCYQFIPGFEPTGEEEN